MQFECKNSFDERSTRNEQPHAVGCSYTHIYRDVCINPVYPEEYCDYKPQHTLNCVCNSGNCPVQGLIL